MMLSSNLASSVSSRITGFDQIDPFVAGSWEPNLPWGDAWFSSRALAVHLDQSTDNASRPLTKIRQQLAFLRSIGVLYSGVTILDLSCGPGLYARALLESVPIGAYFGLDVGPALISHAEGLRLSPNVRFKHADMFESQLPRAGCILMLYDIFNHFSMDRMRPLFRKISDLLPVGGALILELVNKFPQVEYEQECTELPLGDFCADPHLLFRETGHPRDRRFWGSRYAVVRLADNSLREILNFRRRYSVEEVQSFLSSFGLHIVEAFDGFSPRPFHASHSESLVLRVERAA